MSGENCSTPFLDEASLYEGVSLAPMRNGDPTALFPISLISMGPKRVWAMGPAQLCSEDEHTTGDAFPIAEDLSSVDGFVAEQRW